MCTLLEPFTKLSLWHVCLFILCLVYTWSRRKHYWLSWQLPGPVAFPLIGNAYVIMQGKSSIVNTMSSYIGKYRSPSRLVRFWNGPELYLLVGDASVAFQINRAIIQKPEFTKYLGGLYFKQGLVSDSCSTDVLHWKWARKAIQPAFGFENFKLFIQKFHAESLATVEELRAFAETGESFYALDQTRNFSFHTVMRTLFDYELRKNHTKEECHVLLELLEEMFKHFQNRLTMPLYRSTFIYSLVGLRQRENEEMKALLSFVRNVIEQKREEMQGPEYQIGNTFVERLLQNPEFEMDELVLQGATLITAGIDTTKSQNLMLLLMLALHPEVQDNVYKELLDILGDDVTQVPSHKDLMRLDYLDRVIKECLRMYPAAPVLARKAYEEITVTADDGEYTIPAGTSILSMVYAIHYNPDYYDHPEKFNPDRWLPEQSEPRHPHAYIPFSSGARNCIGIKYANLQMKVLAATLVRTFEILPSELCRSLSDISIEMSITINLKKNGQIILRPRDRDSSR